ncbi:aminoglycoside adenylyltransferase domain-containing protein [Streptomyces luteogriseus]|uniref:aminoglycoside adenylyltransferase domain-containing protein n=1 Tax=Streptomyces luteogriseus TaxID=68233 RepID=UPI0036EB2CB4
MPETSGGRSSPGCRSHRRNSRRTPATCCSPWPGPGPRSTPQGSGPRTPAAERAAARLPAAHRPVLDHARAVHLGDEDERWDELGVRPCAELQVRVIEESYAS